MSTTSTITLPLIEDSLLDPSPFQRSSFSVQNSPRPPKSFHAFTDALRNSSTKLDDMLEELDLSKDQADSLAASQKYASHRQLRTTLLSQQLTIAAQDHAQHALQTLLKLLDSHHAAIARLAATQILAYANLPHGAPTPPSQSPILTTQSSPSSPPLIIHHSEFSISPVPPARPSAFSTFKRSAITALALGCVLCVLSFTFPRLSALVPHCLSAFPRPSPLCFPVPLPILPIPSESTFDLCKTSSSGTEKGTRVSIHPPTGQDGQPTTTPTTLSRRTFVSLLGLGGAALITGCQDPNTGKPAAATPPLAPHPAPKPLAAADEYAAPVPTKPLPPPVTTVAPKNTYGILPRSLWARGGPDLGRVDPMNGVQLITFHHSGDPIPFWATDFGETAQHLESVRAYHRSRNFQDIGYHFAIDRVGRVWQLRSMKYQGQHVRYNNEHNIGVVVLGNFQLQSMTQAQKDKVRIFGLLLRKEYGLPISRVYTHQEIVSTECPGHNMQPYMVAIRKQRLI